MVATKVIKGEFPAYMNIVAFTAGEAIVEDAVVYLKSDGKVYNTDGVTNVPLGTCRTVVQYDGTATAAGDTIEIATFGPIRRVKSGGTCTIGKLLEAMASGLVQNGSVTADNWVIGLCLLTAASGETTYMMDLLAAHLDTIAQVNVD